MCVCVCVNQSINQSIFLQTWHINNKVMVPATFSKYLSTIHFEQAHPTLGGIIQCPHNPKKNSTPHKLKHRANQQPMTQESGLSQFTNNSKRKCSICTRIFRNHTLTTHPSKDLVGPAKETSQRGATRPYQPSKIPPLSIREPSQSRTLDRFESLTIPYQMPTRECLQA